MSTRSEIIIKKQWTHTDTGKKYVDKIKLYHHHDGYPSGVGKFLMEQIYPKLQSSNHNYVDDLANFLIKHKDDDEYEITLGNHLDIEYQYIIDINRKTIKCYAGHYNYFGYEEEREPKRITFIKTKECDLKEFLPFNPKVLFT